MALKMLPYPVVRWEIALKMLPHVVPPCCLVEDGSKDVAHVAPPCCRVDDGSKDVAPSCPTLLPGRRWL
jgi:hypothetical protein